MMPRPTWEIASLFPEQGYWSEDEYLALRTNHLVELSRGWLEFPPLPTSSHQFIVGHLSQLVQAFASPQDLGTVLFAPLPVRLWRGKMREPDIVFMLTENYDRLGERFWKCADLVMEVVGETGADRLQDLVVKRREYARAGIPEYWIIDPRKETITVLQLSGKRYAVYGKFKVGTTADSPTLAGLTADVAAVFAAGLRRGRKSRRRPS